ncbi:MOSC domain-containing protein [Sphingomonas sp. CFBP 13728]|uniref:MOSC domain-containing protein n=1 Tax=Sphingomonas sp. CFBP 13728 TaxID=2775294 RepID=UPI0017824E7C|nr:MOSC N-terminal beta barrel domain-containing protein [Sphingomonas sp. CFBP 13728]MBD8618976.1 MOSC domain-containing protein [Sphingomonas sp. CFBP 13728]
MMIVSSLFRYPVKSLGGHALEHADLEARGIAGDRRWMLVDDADRFITRRQVPDMARIGVTVEGSHILFHHAELGTCEAAVPDDSVAGVAATVWRDTVMVRFGNPEADAFLSKALGRPVRLAYHYDESVRAIHPDWSMPGEQVSLADGFPLLVTTEASLVALNDRLANGVTMARFRPNIVIAGAEPWAEDRWRRIRIGTTVLRIARPCSRCIIVTQQPLTGERLDGNEPLGTLRAMGHANAGGIMFGQNAVPERFGTIAVGDNVEVLEQGDGNV